MANELAAKWRDRSTWRLEDAGRLVLDVPCRRTREVGRARRRHPQRSGRRRWRQKGLPGWLIMNRYQEITTQLGYKWPRKWAVKK